MRNQVDTIQSTRGGIQGTKNHLEIRLRTMTIKITYPDNSNVVGQAGEVYATADDGDVTPFVTDNGGDVAVYTPASDGPYRVRLTDVNAMFFHNPASHGDPADVAVNTANVIVLSPMVRVVDELGMRVGGARVHFSAGMPADLDVNTDPDGRFRVAIARVAHVSGISIADAHEGGASEACTTTTGTHLHFR